MKMAVLIFLECLPSEDCLKTILGYKFTIFGILSALLFFSDILNNFEYVFLYNLTLWFSFRGQK